MGKQTKIEWTDSTWNPIRGCSRVSEGCRNCYAERVAARFSGKGEPYEGLAIWREIPQASGGVRLEPQWTGKIRLIDSHLYDPLRWKDPRKIFVNSMTDPFHPGVTESALDSIFAVMALSDWHIHQMLTKRVKRMREYTRSVGQIAACDILQARVARFAEAIAIERGESTKSPWWDVWLENWPLKNIWLGASAEDQPNYDYRRDDLENTDAAVIWWSLEPLIGPITLNFDISKRLPDWIVVGGESGPDARPMHPKWPRDIRDECRRAGVPLFFKQWGEFLPIRNERFPQISVHEDGSRSRTLRECEGWKIMSRVTRRIAGVHGHLLDGEEWKQFPKVKDMPALRTQPAQASLGDDFC
jgi:protein gp37